MSPGSNNSLLPTPQRTSGAGCLVFFGLIFFLPGALMIEQSIFGVVKNHVDRLPMAAMGLLFALIGGAIVVGALWSVAATRREAAARAAHPDEPWLWRPAWNASTIADSSNSAVIVSWIIAILWNAIAWPAVIATLYPMPRTVVVSPPPVRAAPQPTSRAVASPRATNRMNARGTTRATTRSVARAAPTRSSPLPPSIPPPLARRDPKLYFILVFPAVGLGLIASASYFTLRRIRFGRSILSLETRPGCIGGWLAGTIETTAPVFADTMHLELRCVSRVSTGSGKGRHTSYTVLWDDAQVLAGRLPMGKLRGSSIPIAFRIPPDVQPTQKPDNDHEILWKLRAHASVEGPDYVADFVVPVFRVPAAASTSQTNVVPAAERIAERLRASVRPQARRGDDPNVSFSLAGGNRKHFIFPGGRNFATDMMMTVMGGVFFGIGLGIWLFVTEPIPRWLFGICFGVLCGLPMLCGGLLMLFRRVELYVDPHGIERHWRLLGIGRISKVSTSDVEAITYDTHMQIGGTPYYSVYAKRTDGKLMTLAASLLRRDAEWVADEIGQSLGMQSERAPSRSLDAAAAMRQE